MGAIRTVADIIRVHGVGKAGSVALIEGQRSLTWGDLHRVKDMVVSGGENVYWVDALPRNPSGKILKKDLRAPYW